MPLTTDEAVTSILAELAKRDDYELPAPRPVIHAAFSRVAHEVPRFFPRVSFGKYGSLMNSDEIEYSWTTHVMNGFISTDNPDLLVHRIRHSIKVHYDADVAPHISPALRRLAPRAAKVFREAVEELSSRDRVDDLIVRRA